MSASVITLSAKELKEMDRRRFDREYSKWAEWQWQDEWPVECTQERFTEMYKPKGIEIEKLHYCVSFSQGDYASFSGRVFLAEWMAATQTCPDGPTYAERYPALYLACDADGSYLTVHGEDGRRGWRIDWHESWTGVGPCGIFANMPEEDWDSLVSEQDSEAGLEDEIRKYCQSIGSEMYRELSDAYLDSTSEESFIESCEANEIMFEVEESEDEVCCDCE
jgi:hypothetical protein